MDYRKELKRYYDYLDTEKPIHKMITNHLLCFADWLNNEHIATQPVDAPDAEQRCVCGRELNFAGHCAVHGKQ